MDIDFAVFSRAVVERIQSSQHPWKFLCVPANMGSYWFEGSNIGAHLAGMHVIVCNHTNFHQVRCASFVTNTTGSKIRIQENRSEEHTSELQSQSNLVCRLLLEKKKKKQHSSVRSQSRKQQE